MLHFFFHLDNVVISLTNTTTTFEGEIAQVRLTLDIANGGSRECGDIRVLYETMDVTASEF